MGARRGVSQQEGPAWGIPLSRAAAREPPYLPFLAFRVLDHTEEGDGVVELPELQERDLGEVSAFRGSTPC